MASKGAFVPFKAPKHYTELELKVAWAHFEDAVAEERLWWVLLEKAARAQGNKAVDPFGTDIPGFVDLLELPVDTTNAFCRALEYNVSVKGAAAFLRGIAEKGRILAERASAADVTLCMYIYQGYRRVSGAKATRHGEAASIFEKAAGYAGNQRSTAYDAAFERYDKLVNYMDDDKAWKQATAICESLLERVEMTAGEANTVEPLVLE